MRWTIDELARRIGAAAEPGSAAVVSGVATLVDAGPDQLAFVARSGYAQELLSTRAGCVIVPRDLAANVPSVALVSDRPHAAFARAAALLHPDPPTGGTRAPSASIADDARVAEDADIGANAVISQGADVGAGVLIEPGAVIGPDVVIGPGSRIGANVVIGRRSRIGARVRIQPGAVIGGEGFGYVWEDDEWLRVPQLGRVVIGDDVQIGAGTTIDCGALDDTVIGDGVLLDNLIQVAHNVRIGDKTAIAGCAGMAGSAVIGRRCTIGGGAGIVGHIEVTDDVHIAAMSLVSHSITEPGAYASGTPMDRHADWRRNAARFRQLDRLARRLQQLERDVGGTAPGRKGKKESP